MSAVIRHVLRGVALAAVLLGAARRAPAGVESLWQNGPSSSMSGMASYVRVGATGAESGSVRCADDFVFTDPSGASAPIVITQIDGHIISTANPGAGHVPVGEIWSDDNGKPGQMIRRLDTGRFVTRLATSGLSQRWLVRFDRFEFTTRPGKRLWLFIGVRTEQGSSQLYYRQAAGSFVGLISRRVLLDGSVFVNGADASQVFYGYQVLGCPTAEIAGAVGAESGDHRSTGAAVQTGRVCGLAGEPCADGCSLADSGARAATVHAFYNPSGAHARVALSFERACAGTGAAAALYRGEYDPDDPCAGFESFVDSDDFTVIAAPGEVLQVVVFETDPGGATGCPYTLRVRGLSGCCTLCPGDASRDLRVNFNDIASVLANWLAQAPNGAGPGDANADGVVDFRDVIAVLTNWLRDFDHAFGSTDRRAPVCLWVPVSDSHLWTEELRGIDPAIFTGGWRGWREQHRVAFAAIRPGYDPIFLHNPFGFEEFAGGPQLDQFLTAPEWATADFAETMQALIAEGHRIILYLGTPDPDDTMEHVEASLAPLLAAGIRDFGFDSTSQNDPNPALPIPAVDDPDHAASSMVNWLESLGVTVWVETAHPTRLSVVDTNWLKRSDDAGWAVARGSIILPYLPAGPGVFDQTWREWFPAFHAEMAARGLLAAMMSHAIRENDSLDLILAPVEGP